MTLRPLFATVFSAILFQSSLCAKDYTVKFNCWNSSGTGGCTKEYGGSHPGIDSSVYNLYRWTSLGAAKGSRIWNYSGSTIKAFHIKIDGTADTFVVPPGAGGVLFPEVWRKKDGKEVLFNTSTGGAGIANNTRFWSYVYPQTPGYPNPYFLGKAFTERQPDPDPNLWEKVANMRKLPIDKFPEQYRDVRGYAESSKGEMLLLCDDELFLLDRESVTLRAVRFQQTLPSGADYITNTPTHDDTPEIFTVWKNHEVLLQINATDIKTWPENLLQK